jgi:hypothetical protein
LNAVASRKVKFISHSDQGGRGDGVQIMVHRGYAYIGHGYSNGLTVLDVRDPKNPRPVAFLPCPPDTRAIHLQTHDELRWPRYRPQGAREVPGSRRPRADGRRRTHMARRMTVTPQICAASTVGYREVWFGADDMAQAFDGTARQVNNSGDGDASGGRFVCCGFFDRAKG